ncbi:3-deoxy-D-manno-octulosonic acid kinase [Pasteurellaceae bacterium Macca]|nr:3-deoxy-D-manno-octulosonic acid kinase [Pasteurellaceae bacterium Macca]
MYYYQFNPKLVPEHTQPLVVQLLDHKNLNSRLLGQSKGRGITYFLYTETELGVNSVLRHYYRGGLFGKFVKDRYAFQSYEQTRAVKEFELLQQLHRWGLPTPRPIGLKITRQFGCYQGDILIEKIENTQDLSQYLQKQPLTYQQYEQLGILIRQLHNYQVQHTDLNIHNILIDNTGKFWLIDFDKCAITEGDSWKKQNLDRLLRSFHKEVGRLAIQFQAENWAALMAGYKQVSPLK